MNFILFSAASDGDAQAMVSLGRGLVLRGHRVTFLGLPVYADLAAQNDISFISVLDLEPCVNNLGQKWLLATRYELLHFERYAVSWNCAAFRVISEFPHEGLVVVGADRPNLWADLFACARFGIPVGRVMLDLPFAGNVVGQKFLLPFGSAQRGLAGRVEVMETRDDLNGEWIQVTCGSRGYSALFEGLCRQLPCGLRGYWATLLEV